MTDNIAGFGGCIPKVVGSWRMFLSALNIGNRIHPYGPSSEDCEFIIIDSKIHIRVIHMTPGNVGNSLLLPRLNNSDPNSNDKRMSLSEEYWFMKWNKPLKIGICNCSFRRSLRYSIVSNQIILQAAGNRESINVLPKKITDVEALVERLIQDTFFEAFQEYYMLKSKETGTVNLGYELTEDENVTVKLRIKCKKYGITKSRGLSENSMSKANPIVNSPKLNCVHTISQRKPLIMLMHGIGASADIWSIIISTLVHKGYEVIAPDMLGHGFSSAPVKPSYYSFSNLLLQALTIFDHYMTNDKRKCTLIGHSYACSLITAMYPHRANQISQLILISGGGPTPLAPPVKENEISPFGCIYTLLNPLLYCGLKRSFFYSSRGKHFKVCYDENGLPNHVLENVAMGQKWPEGDAAFHRRILAPTLLVHGLKDTHITLVQECEMERTIPRAFLELIPNAGHMSMLETPEHLVHMIMCFLDMWR